MEKIICVGKNYLKHAIELGDAVPEEPIYFIKPPSTLFPAEGPNNVLQLKAGHEVHHEVELVFRLDKNADGEFELAHFTFGLDLTLRDIQTRLKKNGHPWEKAKTFANSAVLGTWEPVTSLESVLAQPFELRINGEIRQTGFGREMRWKPNELLQDVQKWFPIKGGDLLFTGTPEGVGPMRPGDTVEVRGGIGLGDPSTPLIHYVIQCQ